MYLVFTRMPGESYRRRLRSLLLYLCYVFRVLISSLVCWFNISALGLVLFQIRVFYDFINTFKRKRKQRCESVPEEREPHQHWGRKLFWKQDFWNTARRTIISVSVTHTGIVSNGISRTVGQFQQDLSPWYNHTGWLGVKHQLTFSKTWKFVLIWLEQRINNSPRLEISRFAACPNFHMHEVFV